MIRKIVTIDEEKCDGCGLCASACHESAIVIENGKAKLLADDYCDGLGDCLPACPSGAITFEEREAAAYDEAKVKERIEKLKTETQKTDTLACGCPGTQVRELKTEPAGVTSELRQWPCQLKLVPENAPFYNNADILISADCAAYAYGGFHGDFMRNKTTLIGCPKLDDENYGKKLTSIFKNNSIKSVTVVRMEVPCCGGIEHFVKTAAADSGKSLPVEVVVISAKGEIVRRELLQN